MKSIINYFVTLIGLLCVSVYADLTSSQRETLLYLHKKARNEVNSSSMKRISWSDSLEESAQAYADKCKGMVHSLEKPENLAGSYKNDVTRLFNLWKDEKDDFEITDENRKYFPGSYYKGKVIGHYTQIVWDDNTKVGCGLAECSNYAYYLVCHYEIGNIIGRTVYESYGSSKATTRKSTTTKRTTTRSTTRSTTRRTTTTNNTTTTTVKVEQSVSNSQEPKISNANSNSTNIFDSVNVNITSVNANITSFNASAAGDILINTKQVPIEEINSNKNKTIEEEKKKDEEKVKEAEEAEENETRDNVITSFIISSVSVSAAAAGFILLSKKKPRAYLTIKENAISLTRKLTKRSVRPSASTESLEKIEEDIYNPTNVC